MPARLAIQASRVHNAWLCLIWIVLFFRPRAKKAMRTVNSTTAVSAFTALSVAFGVAGAKGAAAPDHRPVVTPACPGFLRVSDFLRVLVFPTDCALRRARLTVHALRNIGYSRRSASPSAPRSGAKRPAEECK